MNIFTTQFKVLLGVLVGVIAVGGLAFNQTVLQKEVGDLQRSQMTTAPTVIVTPTVVPTATPSATVKPAVKLQRAVNPTVVR